MEVSSGGADAGASGTADAGESDGGSGEAGGSAGHGSGGGSGEAGSSAGNGSGGSSGESGASAGGAPSGGGNGGSESSAGAAGAAGAPGSCLPTAGCSCETFGGHEYRFCDDVSFYVDAQGDCEAFGMNLVRIDDAAENDWIRATATAKGLLPIEPFVYIGATDVDVEGEWRWTDGEQFWSGNSSGSPVGGLYANWINNRPQTSGVRSCAGMVTDGRWEDRSCTALSHYVCESGP